MSLFTRLLRLLDDLLRGLEDPVDPPEQPDDPDPDISIMSPFTYNLNDGATRLDIRIFQTQKLTDRNDRVPEQNVVRFLGQALRDAGYNYNITFEYPPVAAPSEAATIDTISWFSSHAPNQTSETEAHLLITDARGGGIAFIGEANTRSGRYAIGPGRNIDKLVELVETAPPGVAPSPNLWSNIRANLHEIGHTLGGRHADEMLDPPSMLYNNIEDGWMNAPPP